MSARSDDALDVKGLAKRYLGTDLGMGMAAGGTSFHLESGTFFTLLGPSGCGKTTTLRCIAGLEQPDCGVIQLGGTTFFDSERDINVPLNRRNIGMVFQSYAVWPHMSVAENVGFPLKVARDRSYSRAEIARQVGEALETVNLKGYERRSPTQMSGGQQQRVALARAIVRRPRLLLLDEPLSNLDALLREDMRRELKRLQQQIGVTTIYVTHDQAEALEMSDTIAVLNHGQIVQLGTPREIYHRPRDAFVAGFMGSTNLVAGTIDKGVAAMQRQMVRLADGRSIVAQFPHAAAAGERIAVSIRPEIIGIRPSGAGRDEDTNYLDAIVTECAFLGHASRYTLRAGDLVLQASAGPEAQFETGAEVTLCFAFDAAKGLTAEGAEPAGRPVSTGKVSI